MLTFTVYLLTLRFLFPGYLHPLVPFHSDFYHYTGMAVVSLPAIAAYPRPVAFLFMRLLGTFGLQGLMAGGIAIALVGVLLTIALAARLTAVPRKLLLPFSLFYLVLVFAQPQFYFEHRHDLPAEISYLGLLLALHAWLWWVRSGNRWALLCTAGATVMFAFSKETFFLSAPCLAIGIVLYDRKRWRSHALFLVILVLCEGASVLWDRHVGSPFVDPHASGASAYRIGLSLPSVATLYWHFLRLLLTPATAAMLVLSTVLLARCRECILAVAFIMAGLAALLPHALLPNHSFDEYAWLPSPLAFACLFFVASSRLVERHAAAASLLAASLTFLAFIGHDGYHHRYRGDGLRWYVDQERLTANFMQSWSRLRLLPSGSRVLIAGLDTPFRPWDSSGFSSLAFGPGKTWAVLVKGERQDLASVRLISFQDLPVPADYAASYDQAGKLVALRDAAALHALDSEPSALIPQLASVRKRLTADPSDRNAILSALAESTAWGDDKTAQTALNAAGKGGLSADSWVHFFSDKLQERHSAKGADARR
jgi:hypothetical protein